MVFKRMPKISGIRETSKDVLSIENNHKLCYESESLQASILMRSFFFLEGECKKRLFNPKIFRKATVLKLD